MPNAGAQYSRVAHPVLFQVSGTTAKNQSGLSSLFLTYLNAVIPACEADVDECEDRAVEEILKKGIIPKEKAYMCLKYIFLGLYL